MKTIKEQAEMHAKNSVQIITAVLFLSMAVLVAQVFAQNSAAKQPTQSGVEKTLTGVVSDSMCGAHHMLKDKSPAECTRMCVKQGQKYALVVGQKVYTLEGHKADMDKLAGQRVTVKGTVSGDTVTVVSVTVPKRNRQPNRIESFSYELCGGYRTS